MEELCKAAAGIGLSPWFPIEKIEAMVILVESVNMHDAFIEFVCPPDLKYLKSKDVNKAISQVMTVLEMTITHSSNIPRRLKIGFAPVNNNLCHIGEVLTNS
jgi:hypothetical protein